MTAATRPAARRPEPLVAAKPRALLGLTLGELAIRFLLGALASVTAGLVSLGLGARAGGIPLALPAILVASITLEQRKGDRAAVKDHATFAPLGALGMVAFAAGVVVLLGRLPLGIVLALATAAWALTAFAAYLVVEAVRRRRCSTDPRET